MPTDSIYRIPRKYKNPLVLWNVPWLSWTSRIIWDVRTKHKLDEAVLSWESSACVQRLLPKTPVVLKCPRGRQSQRPLERAVWNWALTAFVCRLVGKCEINGFFLWWWEKMWERLRRKGCHGARNVKTLAKPLWSSSAEHCPFPSSIFQMPGPGHENRALQPSAWHSLPARGGELASPRCSSV